MSEYTPAIEACIEADLRVRGRADVDRIAGVSEQDATEFLARYAREHADAVEPEPGGRAIRARQPAAPVSVGGVSGVPPVAPGGPAAPTVPQPHVGASPVDQVLSVSGGKSLLDSAPTGPPVSKWLWLLPLSLGVIGGVIAWLIVKDDNPRIAKNLLIAGVAVMLISGVASAGLGVLVATNPALSGLASGASGGSGAWPVSTTGRPAFYYFGSPG